MTRPASHCPARAGRKTNLRPQSKLGRRIGVFGGSFDPVHSAHLLVAQDVMERLKLERVIFMPAARPPHKNCKTPFQQRMRMLKTALKGHAGFVVSGLEGLRAGPSYTVESLAALNRSLPGAELFLILGAEQYRELSTWREPKRLPSLARLVVISRPGVSFAPGLVPAQSLAVRQIQVSSSEIRSRVAQGLSIRDMVPDPVRKIIVRNRLYRSV